MESGDYKSFKFINVAPSGGTGGDWQTINEQPDQTVVQQETPNACGHAGIQMLLRWRGVNVSQLEVALTAGVPMEQTTGYDVLKAAANELDSSGNWEGGYVLETEIDSLTRKGLWMAQLQGNLGINRHWVVVEGIDDLGNLKIQDPWGINKKYVPTGAGTKYTMTRNDFEQVWTLFVVYNEPNG